MMFTRLIPNKPADIPTIIQEEINKLNPVNKLFGSRHMSRFWGYGNRINNQTDWDFAFPYHGSEWHEVEKAESLGWVQKPTEKYKDDLHFITWEKMIGEHKVQMCSKINYDLFVGTFYRIEPSFYWKYLHKSSPQVLPKEVQTDIFNQLYKTKGW